MRVEQILVSEPGPVTLYKLSNLLQFYFETIKGIVDCGIGNDRTANGTGDGSSGLTGGQPTATTVGSQDKQQQQLEYDVLETLEELSELCKKMFFNSLSFMSQKFTAQIAKPPLDLR